MEEINQQVGLALKQLRQQRGWSLDQAAQACGVSKAMLGQIERGES
ncbi:MAG: helix-turn-helix domain-containing protein, partial [Aeromonadaceae bacterium]